MSAFTYTWNNGTPVGTTPANQLDTEIQNLKSGLYERLALEHNALDSTETIESATAAGKHIPGKVGVMFQGSTTAINALTNVGDGSLAWDTTIHCVKRYNIATATWSIILGGPLFRAKLSANQTAVQTEATLALTATDYNYGSCWDTTNKRFTAPATGIYLFICRAGTVNCGVLPAYIFISVYVNSTLKAYSNILTTGTANWWYMTNISLMQNLTLNDTVQFKVTSANSVTIQSDIAITAAEGALISAL